MSGLQFVAEPALAGHFASALNRHLRWCREQGYPVPPGLIDFRDWAVVVARGQSSPPGSLPPDDDPVSGGELLVALPEAGRRLGCSLTKVKGLVRAGELPVVLLGGVQRIRVSDLERYVAELSSPPGSFRDRVELKEGA